MRLKDKTTPQIVESPTYLLAGARLFFLATLTLGGAILAALSGVVWAEATGQEKFMIVTGILVSVSSTAYAFIDKTMAHLSEGKAAIANGTVPPIPSPQPPPVAPAP